MNFHLSRDSDFVLTPDRSLLVFLVALFRELVSPCCPLEGASLSSPLCLPTYINAPISSSRCFSDMTKSWSSARFLNSPAGFRISSLHWQVFVFFMGVLVSAEYISAKLRLVIRCDELLRVARKHRAALDATVSHRPRSGPR